MPQKNRKVFQRTMQKKIRIIAYRAQYLDVNVLKRFETAKVPTSSQLEREKQFYKTWRKWHNKLGRLMPQKNRKVFQRTMQKKIRIIAYRAQYLDVNVLKRFETAKVPTSSQLEREKQFYKTWRKSHNKLSGLMPQKPVKFFKELCRKKLELLNTESSNSMQRF